MHEHPESNLRLLRSARAEPKRGQSQVIAVASGKGGVGKSFIASNLAVALAAGGARVLLVDADLGMGDLNLMLGVAPKASLIDVLDGVPVRRALVRTHGVDLLPAQNGGRTLASLKRHEHEFLVDTITSMLGDYDVCIIDAPSGIDEMSPARSLEPTPS